jgi:hypothetical protein
LVLRGGGEVAMNERLIEKGWQSYRALLPPNAPEVQIRETRQAFYGGAAILFEAMMRTLDPGEEPTDRDMHRMAGIQEELAEFGRSLDTRYLR